MIDHDTITHGAKQLDASLQRLRWCGAYLAHQTGAEARYIGETARNMIEWLEITQRQWIARPATCVEFFSCVQSSSPTTGLPSAGVNIATRGAGEASRLDDTSGQPGQSQEPLQDNPAKQPAGTTLENSPQVSNAGSTPDQALDDLDDSPGSDVTTRHPSSSHHQGSSHPADTAKPKATGRPLSPRASLSDLLPFRAKPGPAASRPAAPPRPSLIRRFFSSGKAARYSPHNDHGHVGSSQYAPPDPFQESRDKSAQAMPQHGQVGKNSRPRHEGRGETEPSSSLRASEDLSGPLVQAVQLPLIDWRWEKYNMLAVFQRPLKTFGPVRVRCWRLGYDGYDVAVNTDLARAIGSRHTSTHMERFEALLKRQDIMLNAPCGRSDNALDHALRQGKLDVAVIILQRVQSYRQWATEAFKHDYDPLYVLLTLPTREEYCSQQAVECCSLMLQMKRLLGIRLTRTYGSQKLRHIHIAAFRENDKILAMIVAELKQEGDRKIHRIYDIDNNTPLHYAAASLALGNIKLLCRERGAAAAAGRGYPNRFDVDPTQIAERWYRFAQNRRQEALNRPDSWYAADMFSEKVLKDLLDTHAHERGKKWHEASATELEGLARDVVGVLKGARGQVRSRWGHV